MNKLKKLIAGLLPVLFCIAGFSQQLKLGDNPSVIQKAAVLELQSNNQGLLFPRITDTALINIFSPADGMVIFHALSKKLLVRTGGNWLPLVATPANSFWSVGGNTNGVMKKIGNIDNYDVSIISNNIDRLRISAAGNIGIGTSTPNTATKLDVSGSIKLGASGTVQKNMISFEMVYAAAATVPAATMSQNSFSPGQLDIFADIPALANHTSTTRASVSVSFNQDLPAGLTLASARMNSISRIAVRFLNNATANRTLPAGLRMYVSVIEF